MAAPKVTEQAVDALLSSGALSISGKYAWKVTEDKLWAKVVIPVNCSQPKGPTLRLCVTCGERTSFALVWSNAFRVRGLDINGSHTNKHTNSEHWHWRTHKHRWTDKCNDLFAYTPTDIHATDLQGQLAEFCAECGITCNATLADQPQVQRDYFDEL